MRTPARPQSTRRAILRLLPAGLAMLPRPGRAALAIRLDLPQLRYPGTWNPRPGALTELAREVRLRSRLEPVELPSVVELAEKRLFASPFLYVAGDGAMPPFSRGEITRLQTFVALGGMLVFDAADGGADHRFRDSVTALVGRIFPGRTFSPLSAEHVLFRSFYILPKMVGRTAAAPHVQAVLDRGRILALFLANDLGGALVRDEQGLFVFPCTPGGPRQREQAIRFGINLVLYATCLDYKADRAHVETLLRARKWR